MVLIPFKYKENQFTEVYALDETIWLQRILRKQTKGVYSVRGNGRIFLRYINSTVHHCKIIRIKNGGIDSIEREVYTRKDCPLCMEMKHLFIK